MTRAMSGQLCELCRNRERAFWITARILAPLTDYSQVATGLCPECTGTGEACGLLLRISTGQILPAIIETVAEIPVGIR